MLLRQKTTSCLDDTQNYVPIYISDILSKEEIKELAKNPEFKNCENKNNYEKDELILLFVSLAIKKAFEYKFNYLGKCLEWVKKELQINLDIKPDLATLKHIEKIKETKPSLQMKLSWMEQYSSLEQQKDLYNITNISENKENNFQKRQSMFNFCKRNSLDQTSKISKCDISKIPINLLNFDSPQFNIFDLEEKVDSKNTMAVVGTFIFSYLNLFNLINYQRFESFIYNVAKGYNRNNSYHTDLHAADMMQTLFVYYLKGQLKKNL